MVEGYGILQPRVSDTMASAAGSLFALAYAGHTGIDPYTTAVADTYHDLFAEGIFTGKGLYDVDAFVAAHEGRVAENRCAPLERLVFLAQGDVNAVLPLSPTAAARRLLPAASVPWFDADHVGEALEACDRLVGRVPASLLTFRPDGGAVDLVESLLGGEPGARPGADVVRPVDGRPRL